MRGIKIMSYCKGINGPKIYSRDFTLCSHPDCYQCRTFERILREEASQKLLLDKLIEIVKQDGEKRS